MSTAVLLNSVSIAKKNILKDSAKKSDDCSIQKHI